jgi:hypothetical protein
MSENMDNLSVSLPEQKNYELAYGLALKLASDKLATIGNIQDQCRRSGATFNEQTNTIEVRYLDEIYQVNLPDMRISKPGGADTVELRDQILILHYLGDAKGTSLSKKVIAFQEFEQGSNYYPTFYKRSVQPLIQYFGQQPGNLLKLSSELGGRKSDYGDISTTIFAFPNIPITYVLWQGDDEFPPNANILFDSTVLDYLPVEDVIVLCQTITWKLVKAFLSKK